MLDLKLYDTPDTVRRTIDAVTALGVSMVTVHIRCVHDAVERGIDVLAVNHLTSAGPGMGHRDDAYDVASGIVCHPHSAPYYRDVYGTAKRIVCPGIRPMGTADNNHIRPVMPAEAANLGANFVVVGRPIWQSRDPAAIARQIIAELSA